ncbi:MAG: 4'-phosphopantetheinyl transferase family protein [Planctomycetaceae bacterium]
MLEGLTSADLHVWYARLAGRGANDCNLPLDLLDETERVRSERFLSDDAREQFVVGRRLLRTTLSRYAPIRPEEWRFEFNSQGKPAIAESHQLGWLSFNLSHTSGMVLCAISRECEVGVDVEPRHTRCDLQIARRFFTPSESTAIMEAAEETRAGLFAQFWTLKEAVIKARGLGLSMPLSSFEIRLDSPPPRVHFDDDEGRDWRLFSIPLADDFQAAAAVYGSVAHQTRLTVREWRPS